MQIIKNVKPPKDFAIDYKPNFLYNSGQLSQRDFEDSRNLSQSQIEQNLSDRKSRKFREEFKSTFRESNQAPKQN